MKYFLSAKWAHVLQITSCVQFLLDSSHVLSYSYTTVPGICGSKQSESKGVAQGQCLFTTALNPWPPVLYIPPDWLFVVTVNTSVHVQVFTVTNIIYTIKSVL